MKKLVFKVLISGILTAASCALFAADTDKSAETAAAEQKAPAFDEKAVKVEVEKLLNDSSKFFREKNIDALLQMVADEDKIKAKADIESYISTMDSKKIPTYITVEEIRVKDASTIEVIGREKNGDTEWNTFAILKQVNGKWLFVTKLTEDTVKAEVEQFLHDNLKAMQDENLEASLATVAEKDKAQAKAIFEQIFKTYDLKYTLEKIDIAIKDANTVEATVVQRTEKVAGPEFKNNRAKILHTIKKADGKWRFAGAKIISVDFLDNQ